MKEKELLGSAQAEIKAIDFLSKQLRADLSQLLDGSNIKLIKKSMAVTASYQRELERMKELIEGLLCENI